MKSKLPITLFTVIEIKTTDRHFPNWQDLLQKAA
jgi:hypothetical protein